MNLTAAMGSQTAQARKAEPHAGGIVIALGIAAAVFVVQMLVAPRYGYFRDELYYIACARHLDFGYVDQPPLVAAILWVVLHTLGSGLRAIRLLPILSGALLTLTAAVMARDLGARRFGQTLAALCVALAPAYLVIDHIYTMNAFEEVLWAGCAWVLLRILRGGNPRLWLWYGLLAGIGLENKYSMLLFGLGTVVGLLLTPQRRWFRSGYLWLGAAVCLLVFLPNLIWNLQRHFPFLELLRNIHASGRDVTHRPPVFLAVQALIMGPLAAPVGMAGLAWLMFSHDGRPFRVLGWAYLTALAAVMLAGGKHYYLAPAYTMLFAAGGVAVERLTAQPRWAGARAAYVISLIAATVLFLPHLLPVLPAEAYVRYARRIPLSAPTMHLDPGPMGEEYGEMFGWEEMVRSVAAFYNSLPPELRARTAIHAGNYGEAAAVDFFGPKYGLPKAISGHQNYWYWGPRDYTAESVILVGRLGPWAGCRNLKQVARIFHPYAMPFENRPLYYCQDGPTPLASLWNREKYWD